MKQHHTPTPAALLMLAGVCLFSPAAAEELPPVIAVDLGTSVTLRLRRIEAGTFLMGAPWDEVARYPEESPQTPVTITEPFYLGETEVTQQQYEALLRRNPSVFRGEELPVGNLDRADAEAFARAFAERTGIPAGLPSEAQWEYSCRAGTTTRYSFGDDDLLLDRHAWHDGNARGRLMPVGRKEPNPWGLYDMHGNAWEWTGSNHFVYPGTPLTDPAGDPDSTIAIIRPGVWYLDDFILRSATRSLWPAAARDQFFGMRLCVPMTDALRENLRRGGQKEPPPP